MWNAGRPRGRASISSSCMLDPPGAPRPTGGSGASRRRRPPTAEGRRRTSRRGGGACRGPPRRWAPRGRGLCRALGNRRGSGSRRRLVGNPGMSRHEAAGTGRTPCSRCSLPGRCRTSRRGGAGAPARGPPRRRPVPEAPERSPGPGPSPQAPPRAPDSPGPGNVPDPVPTRTGRRHQMPLSGQEWPPTPPQSTLVSSRTSFGNGLSPIVVRVPTL